MNKETRMIQVSISPSLQLDLSARAGEEVEFSDPLDDLAFAALGALLEQQPSSHVAVEAGSRVAKHLAALLVDVEEAEPASTSKALRRAARVALVALGRARPLWPGEVTDRGRADFRLDGVGYVWETARPDSAVMSSDA